VKGEFVGGSDIVRQMFQAGELKTFLPNRACWKTKNPFSPCGRSEQASRQSD